MSQAHLCFKLHFFCKKKTETTTITKKPLNVQCVQEVEKAVTKFKWILTVQKTKSDNQIHICNLNSGWFSGWSSLFSAFVGR